uniref:Innexin n=1 Tax=Dracunculus medinensis TaxID=318479 RepID=A0A0N4UAK5_DRAME
LNKKMLDISIFTKLLPSIKSNGLDDSVDRLHSFATVRFLIFCAIFIGGKQYFGEPLQCMLPAHLERWSSYGQYYCFVEGTYRLSYNKAIPSASVRADMKAAKDINVNYYQVRDKEILFFAKNLLKN